jgi:type I restriction enzyme S subunit
MSFLRYPTYKESGVEWLGEVPEQWDVKRFQRCVYVAEGQVDPETPAYCAMSLIAPNHVESGTGRLLGLETATDQGAESGKYLCKTGDVVYSKIRPALRKVCIAPEDCLCSADMYPLRGHSGLSNLFLFWSMLSEQFSALAVLESQRVAMPKINRESLKDVTFALPPLEEQLALAAFLDRETAKIDALVEEQRRLMELLKEKRQAVISHAVTKGLNPNAPMKPSGIEWLGEVPKHWEVSAIKRFADTITDGAHISPETDGGIYPFVSTKDVADDSIDLENCLRTSEHSYEYMVKTGCRPLVDDVLFSKDGTIGRTVVVREDREFVVASSLIIIRPVKAALDPHFLNWNCPDFLDRVVMPRWIVEQRAVLSRPA